MPELFLLRNSRIRKEDAEREILPNSVEIGNGLISYLGDSPIGWVEVGQPGFPNSGARKESSCFLGLRRQCHPWFLSWLVFILSTIIEHVLCAGLA